jgi:hypothetical protein
MKLKISLAACAAFFLLVTSIFAALPPAENLLPADTLMVLTVPDWSALRAESKQSPQWLLWSDPAMKPFRDDFTAKWEQKFIGPLEQNLGVKIDDYVPLLQGQLTFAITQNGWDGSSGATPAMVLLLDSRDKSGLLADNLAALKKQWVASGKPVQTQVLQGIKFSMLTLSSNTPMPFASAMPHGADNNSTPQTIYIGQYQSLLMVGTSVKVIESVAAHLTGGANPALRDNAQFAADRLSQFHDAPLYYGWFNAKAFVSVLSQVQIGGDSGGFQIPWNNILVASGLQGLKSVSFTYRESREGAEVELYADVPASSRQGIFKIITAAPKDANPPPFVPADAVKFFRWRVDGQQAWAELQRMLNAISPTFGAGLTSFLAMANANAQQQDPNFDITKNLIGNLGDDWIRFEKAPADDTMQSLNSGPWLFVFAANNADQAAAAIKSVAGMLSAASPPQERQFLGRKIYTITLPSHGPAGANGATAAPVSLYCTASGGYVALTTDVSMIENYLRSDDGKTKPLSRTPGLVEAAQHVGGMGNGLFGYQNQRETARSLFAALKNDPAAGALALNPLSMWPSASGMGLKDLMDFSLLPDYDQISKYFSFTVYGGSSTSEGLDLKIYTPRPPELN